MATPAGAHPRCPAPTPGRPDTIIPARWKGVKSGKASSPSQTPRFFFCHLQTQGSFAVWKSPHKSPPHPPPPLPRELLSFHGESCVPTNPTSCPVPGEKREPTLGTKRVGRSDKEQGAEQPRNPGLHSLSPHTLPQLGEGPSALAPVLLLMVSQRGWPGRGSGGAGSAPQAETPGPMW